MTTSSGSIARLLVLGVLFHLIYIGTVFDCYFTSPVVHGMRHYTSPQPQAKRLVLIVGADPDSSTNPLAFGGETDVAHPTLQVTVCALTLPSPQMPPKSYLARRSASRPI